MRHHWDYDREDVENHWKSISFFKRLTIIILFWLIGRSDNVSYIINRLFIEQGRMVRYKELHWESIESFLMRKL